MGRSNIAWINIQIKTLSILIVSAAVDTMTHIDIIFYVNVLIEQLSKQASFLYMYLWERYQTKCKKKSLGELSYSSVRARCGAGEKT